MRDLSTFNRAFQAAARAPNPFGSPASGRARRLKEWLAAGALALLAGRAPGGAPPAAKEALDWPLDPPTRLSSTFGEYREGGRVHGGVDLSTGGRNGLPVRAAADGEVFRLKLEWRGYGRAIYQRLADGRILLYAHLERFLPGRLEEVAGEARGRAGRYPGDLAVSPPLPVRRGEPIALSGESGAGFPHLHFEVRSAANAPQDPQGEGIRFEEEDSEPPAFEGVWLFAGAADAWIEGAAWSRRLQARRVGTGSWEAGPARVAGPFDLAIEAYDPGPQGDRRGVAALDLFWDGQRTSGRRLRAFSFEEARRAAGVYDAELSRLSPARFAYRPLVAGGGPWSDGEPSGLLHGEPGTSHALEAEIRDAAGNASRLRLQVRFVAGPELVRPAAPPGTPAASDAAGAVSGIQLGGARWIAGAVALPLAPRPGAGSPSLSYRILQDDGLGDPAAALWASETRAGSGGAAELMVVRLPADGRLRFKPQSPGPVLQAAQKRMRGSALRLDCGELRLELPAGAFERGTPVTIQQLPEPRAAGGLLEAGAAFAVEPAWRVPLQAARLRFMFDARLHRPGRVGVYRWDAERGRWSYEGGAGGAQAGSLEVAVGELGTFRLLEDVQPPDLGKLSPAPGARRDPQGWVVRVEASDSGSGLDWDGVEIQLDGAPLESEYDPDRKWAVALPPAPLSEGEHRLWVRARDRAGNETAGREWRFTVRARR